MNLAIRDIRHKLGRFALTALGLGLLLLIVLGMGGILKGIEGDATLLIDALDADLWIVQHDTRGPFAELSRIAPTLEDRARSVPGVAGARRFVTHTVQRTHNGKPLRAMLVGLAWPGDRGEWIPLIAGRSLAQAHYEVVVDRSLNLAIGETLRLGKDDYRVVGIADAMVGSGGDGLAFLTVADAQAIQLNTVGEATRLERSARRVRGEQQDLGQTQPGLLERAEGPASLNPALGPPPVSAVLVNLDPGVDPEFVREILSGWPDIGAFTGAEQRDLLLKGPVDRARRQIGLFRVLLVIISAILMALILYTMTLDKLHDIALLKLMGARNTMILGLVLQEAFALGAIAYAVAYLLGGFVFPYFPRRVIITGDMLVWLSVAVFALCIAGSSLGIWKAMRVAPNEVLA